MSGSGVYPTNRSIVMMSWGARNDPHEASACKICSSTSHGSADPAGCAGYARRWQRERQGTSASAVAQAPANFIKVMSGHAPAVGRGHGWSGYADSETGSRTVSQVSGNWTLPGVRCLPSPYQNQDAFLSSGVGVDGFTDQTVEQLGTAAQCFEGVLYYYVWYEMYPAGTVEEGTTACINDNVDCPEPGDQISASVSVTSAGSGENNYKLTLVDHTRPAESFSVTQ